VSSQSHDRISASERRRRGTRNDHRPATPAASDQLIDSLAYRRVERHSLAFNGYRPGCSIESTDRSISRSGQWRWPGCGRSSRRISATVARLNHGYSSKGRNSSRSSSNSQTPCWEMLVTAACEVGAPGIRVSCSRCYQLFRPDADQYRADRGFVSRRLRAPTSRPRAQNAAKTSVAPGSRVGRVTASRVCSRLCADRSPDITRCYVEALSRAVIGLCRRVVGVVRSPRPSRCPSSPWDCGTAPRRETRLGIGRCACLRA
jgi:hypothetical protein